MFLTPLFRNQIPMILLLMLTNGCDDRATRIAREAADRQAGQNTAMADLNKEVASGTHQLVAADAEARKEIIGVHHDLQAERTRLDTGKDVLERERREIALERRTESMIVPVTSLVTSMLLVASLLGFCWYVLVAARSSDSTDAQLNEILVCEILANARPAFADESLPFFTGHPALDDRPQD